MKQRVLVSSILLALCAGAVTTVARAQTSDDQASQTQSTTAEKKGQRLKTIVVTGSLIPQAQVETASPVITISAQQLERQGFGTVYDALSAQPLSTGAVQNNQFNIGFTPGAQTISLLGLDPAFTLFLINGHPLSDYPLLYNGQSNFVDLSNIPVGMVDRIDILPGNQSSIYGSSAIAGVVNIILKDKIDGYELNVRAGGYSDGGGRNERLEFLGGRSFGNLDVTFGLQFNNQQPIWGYDRDLTRSTLASPNPNTTYGSRVFLRAYYDLSAGRSFYMDPGSDACAPGSGLVGGTTGYENRPGQGYFCGSQYLVGYSTIYDKNRGGTGYLNVKYKLNDSAELYANVLYNVSTIGFSSGPYFWQTNNFNFIFNGDSGQLELFQRDFTPEEVGNPDLYSTRQLVRTYDAFGGLRGTVAENWDYDLYYARSQTNLTEKYDWPLSDAVNSFFQNKFLGPQLGTYYGYPIYSPNLENFYKPITPADYSSFIGQIDNVASTWTQNINLQFSNTDLLSLPAGSVGLAGLIQAGNQSWQNPGDARLNAGDYFGLTGTAGGGHRDNWAVAAELRIPIFSMLTADVSSRYDHYSNKTVGGGDSKPTYKLGLEFRPTDSLLFRGDYATAFRAPDMAYTFGGQSGFYQAGLTDYYRCAVTQPNVPLQDCNYYASTQVEGIHEGNPGLKSITAKSYGFGAVWSPTPEFTLKADYYNIRIKNEVTLQSLDLLLKTESDCLLGNLDASSPTCVAAVSQVKRNGADAPIPYTIQSVTVLPINVANERVSGILASLHYIYDLGRWGKLGFQSQYNVTLKHSYMQYPNDPVIDLLRNPYFSSEFKTIANASVTWDIDRFSATLYGTRYGKTPNYTAQINTNGYGASGAGTVAPWMVYNASVSYNITDDMKITGIVNNIKNSAPPHDPTWSAAPFYNIFNFNDYGRAYWLEFDWRFGRNQN